MERLGRSLHDPRIDNVLRTVPKAVVFTDVPEARSTAEDKSSSDTEHAAQSIVAEKKRL